MTAHLEVVPVQRLREEFGLAGASAILLTGSRVAGGDYPGSDVDFLAIFDDPAAVPAAIGHPGAVSMANSMGENWLGRVGGEEVNVAAVSAVTVRRLAGLLAAPIGPLRTPALQQFEIVLLQRLRVGVPVLGEEYLAGLVDQRVLARLPVATFVLYFTSAAGHVQTARRLLDAGDPFAFEMLMMAAVGAIGLSTLCLCDRSAASFKKVATELAALEQRHPGLPVRRADLVAIGSGSSPPLRLALAEAALARLRGAVPDGAPWAEARDAL